MNTINKTLTAVALVATAFAANATGNHGGGTPNVDIKNTNINGSYNTKNVYDDSKHYDNREYKTTNNDNRDYSKHEDNRDYSQHNTANGGKGGSVGDTTATGGDAKQDQNQQQTQGQQQQATGGDATGGNAAANNGGVQNSVGGNNSSYNSVYKEAANAVPIYNTVIGKCKMGINIGGSTVGGTGGVGAAWDSNKCHEGREKAELEQKRMDNYSQMIAQPNAGVKAIGIQATTIGTPNGEKAVEKVGGAFAAATCDRAQNSPVALLDKNIAKAVCDNDAKQSALNFQRHMQFQQHEMK